MPINISTINRILKNKIFHYIFSRYATYFIQFINSLFIAVYLGPYFLGIWGFITLIIQYFNRIGFGISPSVNAIISINKNKEWYVKKIIGSSITMLIGLSSIIILFFILIKIVDLPLGKNYGFDKYAPAVIAIGIIGYFNTLLSGIFRVYGRVQEIAINQSAFPVLMLITILIFKGEQLLWALVYANLVAFLLSLFIYLFRTPIKLRPLFIGRLFKEIQIKGWHLFIYNSSFYLMAISTRSFVSANYTVEEFGYFTFAFSMANTILLLINSFSFLIYPKVLNRFATSKDQSNIALLTKLRLTFITTSHLLAYLAFVFFPILLIFIPKFQDSYGAFILISLTLILYSNSFGYSGLLIAKGFERNLSSISFISLLVNIIIVYILTSILKVHFSIAILGTMLTYFVYVYLLTKKGRRFLNLDIGILPILKDSFSINLLIPYVTATVLAILNLSPLFMILPLCIFIVLNIGALHSIKSYIGQFILNPNIADI